MQQHDTDTRPCRRNRNVQKTEYCAKKSHLVYEGVRVCVSPSTNCVCPPNILNDKNGQDLAEKQKHCFQACWGVQYSPGKPGNGNETGQAGLYKYNWGNLCSNNLSQNITTNPDLMVMLCWQRSWTAYSPANKNNNNKITHTSGQHLLHLYSGGAWPDISSSEPQKSSRTWMCQ